MKNWKTRENALYYEVGRDLVNLYKVIDVLKFHKFNGVIELKSLENKWEYPIIKGRIISDEDISQLEFDIFSVYRANHNFLIHYFKLNEEPKIVYSTNEPVWVNLESINMNMREFFRKLNYISLTGFVKIENRVNYNDYYIFFYLGDVVAGQIEDLKTPAVIPDIIKDLKEYPCSINVYSLPQEFLIFFLSKTRYIKTLRSLDGIENVLEKDKFYLIQGIKPNKVGYATYDESGLNFYDDIKEYDYFEIHELVKIPSKLPTIDIFEYVAVEDKFKFIKDPEGSIIYFCPACWSVIKKEDIVCPNCGFDLREFHEMDYEYKLILSLEHPIKEWRKNVIHTIGLKRLEEAVPYLDIMVDKEQDPFVLMEIADTLAKIGTPDVIPILRKLSEHKYILVRNKARFLLNSISKKMGI
ncbi:MAG: HEAT repeat domain-containing protein [Sulfurihydrogenibium sp.]